MVHGGRGDAASRGVGRGAEKAERACEPLCGTGNAAIRAALARARTIGVDLTQELLVTAPDLAAQAGVKVDFREGDVEDAQVDDASVNVIVSTFGCEVAPRHQVVAREIARVLRPGGRIGLCVGTLDGTIGAIMRTTAAISRHPHRERGCRWGGATPATFASSSTARATKSASSGPFSNTSRSPQLTPTTVSSR